MPPHFPADKQTKHQNLSHQPRVAGGMVSTNHGYIKTYRLYYLTRVKTDHALSNLAQEYISENSKNVSHIHDVPLQAFNVG